MTGFHGLHVIGGLVAMLVLLLRASNPRFDAGEAPSVEVVSYYWHFVDVVWIGLWATLFLLR
jgi:cytochrome c oxidase subunit 3